MNVYRQNSCECRLFSLDFCLNCKLIAPSEHRHFYRQLDSESERFAHELLCFKDRFRTAFSGGGTERDVICCSIMAGSSPRHDHRPRAGRSRPCGRWLAVLVAWSLWFFWGGLIKGLGVLLPTLQVQFATRTWIVGWIIGMATAAIGISGRCKVLLINELGKVK